MADDHLAELRAEASYARQRHQLYKAKAYGPRATSSARMRELERVSDYAQARLRAAEERTRTGPPQEHQPQH
jgi:hypothetical protein